MAKLEAYERSLPYSYALGAFPSLQLIAARPEAVRRLLVHPDALESEGVYASTGSACSSKKLKVSGVLTAMGIAPARAEWALRFSLSPHTTNEEIDYAAQCLGTLHAQLKKYARR